MEYQHKSREVQCKGAFYFWFLDTNIDKREVFCVWLLISGASLGGQQRSQVHKLCRGLLPSPISSFLLGFYAVIQEFSVRLLFHIKESLGCKFVYVTEGFLVSPCANSYWWSGISVLSYLGDWDLVWPTVSDTQSNIPAICGSLLLPVCWHYWQWARVPWKYPLVCGDSWSFLQQCMWAGFGFQFSKGLLSLTFLFIFALPSHQLISWPYWCQFLALILAPASYDSCCCSQTHHIYAVYVWNCYLQNITSYLYSCRSTLFWTSSYLLESCKKPAKRCNCSPLLILLWFANGQET